jgi:hypothetical protein
VLQGCRARCRKLAFSRFAPHIVFRAVLSKTIPLEADMSWTYSCPRCGAMLNPDETVVLIGEHAGTRVLVGFHPEPGNYKAYMPPGAEANDGSRWEFFCPLCRASLVTELSTELCALDMLARGVAHRVYFSRTAGDHATFVVSAEGIERLGEDVERHSLEILDLV